MPPRARSGPRAPWRLGRRHLVIALTALLLAAPGPSMLHTCQASSSKPSSRDALRAMAKAFSAQNQQAQQAHWQPYSGPKSGIKGLYSSDSPENSPVPGDLNNPECLYFRTPWYNENGDPSHRVCRGEPAPPPPVTQTVVQDGEISMSVAPGKWTSFSRDVTEDILSPLTLAEAGFHPAGCGSQNTNHRFFSVEVLGLEACSGGALVTTCDPDGQLDFDTVLVAYIEDTRGINPPQMLGCNDDGAPSADSEICTANQGFASYFNLPARQYAAYERLKFIGMGWGSSRVNPAGLGKFNANVHCKA